jgi:hypothetical protein
VDDATAMNEASNSSKFSSNKARAWRSIKELPSASTAPYQIDIDFQTNSPAYLYNMHFPQLKTAVAVPVMTAMILSTPGTQAMPTAASLVSGVKSLLPRAIEARGFNGMGPVTLYLAVKDYLKDRNAVSKEHYFTTQTSNNFLAV